MPVAGLVLGIVSSVGAWIPGVNFVAWIAGIVGIILSVKGKKQLEAAGQPTGIATAGLILSIVGTALAVIGLICTICVLAGASAIGAGALNETLNLWQ